MASPGLADSPPCLAEPGGVPFPLLGPDIGMSDPFAGPTRWARIQPGSPQRPPHSCTPLSGPAAFPVPWQQVCTLQVCVLRGMCNPAVYNQARQPILPWSPDSPHPRWQGWHQGWVTSSSHLQDRQPPPGISPVRGGGAGSHGMVGEIVGELLSHEAPTPPTLPETRWGGEGHGLACGGGSETKGAAGGWPHAADTCWGGSRAASEREWGPSPIL